MIMASHDLGSIAMSAEMLVASAAHLELQSLHAHFKHMFGGIRERELAVTIQDALAAIKTKYPHAFAGPEFPDELFSLERDAQGVLGRANGSAAHTQPPPYQTDSGIYLGNP